MTRGRQHVLVRPPPAQGDAAAGGRGRGGVAELLADVVHGGEAAAAQGVVGLAAVLGVQQGGWGKLK